MVIAIFGESCVGKSTLAADLKAKLNAEVFTGKDYLRLAKNEAIAKELFRKKLADALAGDHIVYVIAEREHLALIPEGAVRVLMTADLEQILERFSVRMHGNLPAPVKTMLEKKHGIFDWECCDYHIHNNVDTDSVSAAIRATIGA
jgi:predicted kinase